jgi:hypothetical protein
LGDELAALEVKEGSLWKETRMLTKRREAIPPLKEGRLWITSPSEKAQLFAQILENNSHNANFNQHKNHYNLHLSTLILHHNNYTKSLIIAHPKKVPDTTLLFSLYQKNFRGKVLLCSYKFTTPFYVQHTSLTNENTLT